jgi:hypothetical protein
MWTLTLTPKPQTLNPKPQTPNLLPHVDLDPLLFTQIRGSPLAVRGHHKADLRLPPRITRRFAGMFICLNQPLSLGPFVQIKDDEMKDFVVTCRKVFTTACTTVFNTTSTSIVERHGSGHPVPKHISILTNLGDYHLEYLLKYTPMACILLLILTNLGDYHLEYLHLHTSTHSSGHWLGVFLANG